MDIQKGDIVQILDKDHAWYPAILIVDEVKSWGVTAYIIIPLTNTNPSSVGHAYIRLPFQLIGKVGEALLLLLD